MTPTRVAPILAVLGFVSLVAGCSGAVEQVSCAPNPCRESDRTRCEMDGTVARCLCDTGYVEINGACISSAACIPNPCTAPYQTTCIPLGPSAAAVCVCDPGHAPAGTGCDPFPIFDCGVAHTTGFPDAWEPDECPNKATELISSIWTDGHTLNPTGDVDWFRFEGLANHIYELRATSDDVELYADAYAADGVSALGADHRGTKAIAIWFKSPSNDALYARIQALRGNATGAYRVQITDIGMDDFADVTVTALSIAADTHITGELQFDADRDVLKLPFQGGIAYAVTFEFFGVGTPLFELVAADGVTVMQKLSGLNVGIVTRSPGAGAVFLRVSGLTTNTLGPFAITTATLGPDDHGDVRAEATPIVAGGSPIAVSIDRAGDVDVISFDAVAPNIYAFSCATISGFGSSLSYTLTNESGAVLAQFSTGFGASFAHEASESGKRFVHVRSDFSSTMKLSCKLQNLGLDDHGDTIAEATPIVAGAGASAGKLETADDKDVFSFTAIAAHVYRFQCNAQVYASCSVRFLSSSGAELTLGSSVAWEVSTAGTYYVEVGSGYSGQAASYTFELEDLGADDHGDTFATATAIGTGALGGAALETLIDKDVFSFQALGQHIYRVTCTTTGPGCTLKVFGPTGVLLAQGESYYSSAPMVVYEVAVAGTYYVEVSIGSTYGSSVTSYSYGLEDLGVDDYGDDVLTATSVLVGDGGTATLEFAGEVDAFKFTPTAGRVYRVECTRGTLTSCDLQLKDAIGGTLYSVSNPSHGEIVFEATSGNPVVFTVGGISNYSNFEPEGTYSWSITDVGTDDHGDTHATATPALLPMTAQGAQLESFGDVDVFAFEATAGHIYRVTCTRGTLPNCMKRVKDGAGNLIAEQSYWTSNAPFVATTSATYYVEISSDNSYSYYGNAVGTYSWLIEDVGVDDHGGTLASATNIAAGPPGTAGNLQFRDDVDVFSFDASAGRIYVARCVAGSANNCYVTISNASGTSLATGQNSAAYEASTAQTLFVEISVYYYGELGSYTIVVDDLGPDDHGDTYQTATAMPALGNGVNGVIELYGDVDYFSISLAANTTYSATVIGNYLQAGVYSTNGSSLISGFSSSQTFTTTSAGTYYVEVASWNFSPSKISYTLEVQ
jgi:hypothetical protein